jgi:hypothetical protein
VNAAFIRREWGAITFVLTVLVGLIVVPLALYFTNQGPAPVSVTTVPTVSSARASGVQSPSASSTRLVSPSPTKSP